MLERIKTVILVVLVGTSFYLTYNLWWNNPAYEPLIQSSYEAPNNIGNQISWNILIQPKEIMFHYDNKRHTKAILDTSIYQIVWNSVKDWQFTSPQKYTITAAEGQEILEARNGIELIFADDLAVSFYNDVIHVPDGLDIMMKTFNRIWVYEDEDGEYSVLFLSDALRRAAKAKLLDFEGDRGFGIRNLILLGNMLSEQQPAQYANSPTSTLGYNLDFYNLIYLPVERSYMNQWTYKASYITIEEMAKALFLDITTMKEIPERSGSQIFTDGTKSLQYQESTKAMRFYIPAYEQGKQPEGDRIFHVIDFMNQHYGWTGNYYVDQWSNQPSDLGITFRERVNGYPLYSDEQDGYRYGQISLNYQKNQVTEYARSLLRLDKSMRGYQIQIMSGAELLESLREKKIYLYNIQSIELGYKTVFLADKDEVELIPHYIIHFYSDRDPLLVDARVQNRGE